ncbi:hypothetical protein [Paraburkholderia sp. J76]|uniref:hypothetical protein n=1 Tax=Paraburkholderia sp. J76 TaxID=2805439 RepID=UPI002ABE4C96|nr:hypothetical protein [Paraburkholderia sp. J76]
MSRKLKLWLVPFCIAIGGKAAAQGQCDQACRSALFAQFARIGLTEKGFDPGKLDAATRKGMAEGLNDAPAVAISPFASTSTVRNGWNWGDRPRQLRLQLSAARDGCGALPRRSGRA